jgi:hypothetical protein
MSWSNWLGGSVKTRLIAIKPNGFDITPDGSAYESAVSFPKRGMIQRIYIGSNAGGSTNWSLKLFAGAKGRDLVMSKAGLGQKSARGVWMPFSVAPVGTTLISDFFDAANFSVGDEVIFFFEDAQGFYHVEKNLITAVNGGGGSITIADGISASVDSLGLSQTVYIEKNVDPYQDLVVKKFESPLGQARIWCQNDADSLSLNPYLAIELLVFDE